MDTEGTCLRLGWGLAPIPLAVNRLSFWAMLDLGSLHLCLYVPVITGVAKCLQVMLSPPYVCRAGPLCPACSVPHVELGLLVVNSASDTLPLLRFFQCNGCKEHRNSL